MPAGKVLRGGAGRRPPAGAWPGTFFHKTSKLWNFSAASVRPVAGVQCSSGRAGSALVVALWVLMILSLMVGGLAFNMQVEAAISSQFRKRLAAEYLARGGVELARYILAHLRDVSKEEEFPEGENGDLMMAALHISRGIGVSGLERKLGRGKVVLDIVPEEGRRNVNLLTDEDWEEILDQSNVPEDKWDELIDCFRDWVDPNEEHRLNGAESDDPFYRDRGYECKNAPLDTVDELLLIKGFTPQIVYGGPSEVEGEPPYLGMARWLTVWGDGRVNVNTASREVLLTIPEIDEFAVDAIIEGRKGPDGEAGTRDDGFTSVDEVIAAAGLSREVAHRITVSSYKYLRVVSTGQVGDLAVIVWCVLEYQGDKVRVVFWREDTASKT